VGRFLFGFILGLIVIPIAVYIYFSRGMAPVAVSAQAMPFEKRLARMDLDAHVQREMPKEAPFAPSSDDYASGALVYRQHCAVCHGLPGQTKTAISQGEYPRPPQLFAHGVTDDPVGETYWKVANGIRMTGMPGFKDGLTDQQLWQVSLLLANADKLPAPVNDQLKKPIVPVE
jgi:thiosulfate dehydrogenase